MKEAIMNALLAVWWLVIAIFLTILDKVPPDAAGMLNGFYDVIPLCWISFALFLLLAMLQRDMAVTQRREYIQRGNGDMVQRGVT